jgi:elongation factor Ts
MNANIELIKQLRAETGAGIQDCRKALENYEYDYPKALGYLREQGLEKAAQMNDRPTGESRIEVYTHANGRVGVLVEICTETDFAMRSPALRDFAHELALQVAAAAPAYVRDEDIPTEVLAAEARKAEARAREEGKPERIIPRIVEGVVEKFKNQAVLLRQPYIRDENQKVADLYHQAMLAVRENITIRRVLRWEAGEEL